MDRGASTPTSGARSGLRRELAFLLDSQPRNSPAGSRTRSGKSPVVFSPPKRKKARKAGADVRERGDLGDSGGGSEVRGESVWIIGLGAPGNDGSDKKLASNGNQAVLLGASPAKTPLVANGCSVVDGIDIHSVAEVKVDGLGSGCNSKSDVLRVTDTVEDRQAGMVSREGPKIHRDFSSMETPVKLPSMGNRDVLLQGSTVKKHVAVNGCSVDDQINVDSAIIADVKLDRFGSDHDLKSDGLSIVETVEDEPISMVSPEGFQINGNLSFLETPKRMNSRNVRKVANGLQEKASSRFKKVTSLNRELRSLIDSPVLGNGHESSSICSFSLPSRRVTRSAVKIAAPQGVTSITDILCLENGHGSSNVDSSICEEPGRRITRAAIKVDAEHSGAECKSSGSKESDGGEYAGKGTPSPLGGNDDTSRLSGAESVRDLSDSAYKKLASNKKSIMGKLTRKDVGLHKLVFMNDILPQGTEVGYYVRGQKVLEGYIKDSGIYCFCCNEVVSASKFEAHAGQAPRKKPYNNIYTSNGVSLHELSVSLSKDRRLPTSETDDLCSICADGGDLLLCDLCPRAFHKECVNLTEIPTGDWHCQYCINLHLRDRCVASNENAKAAGRIAGVDPIEQIFKRCIRIVTISDTSVGGCTFCRLHDFSKSRFGDRTVIICDQCEKEYHVGCLREHNMADLKKLPEGEWFCCTECNRIHTGLRKFLRRGLQPLPDPDIDLIRKKCEAKGVSEANYDIRWRLVQGKKASEENKLLLSKSVTMFHESFDPIVDPTTGCDLIPSMVYGRMFKDQDFTGMYSAVLSIGSSVISVGILRVLGGEVAELPLVATSREHQGLGYFQSLFSCIERLLSSLKVKHLVLPSAQEAESIWTKKFGFTRITSDQLKDYLKGTRITVFQGTSVLHKPISLS